jgi:hypothetical protein
VQISQYAYFSLSSETVTAATVTGRLGIEPDKILVRGARDAARVIPRTHEWSVAARRDNRRLNDMISELIERLNPVVEKIATLVRDMPVQARLQIVRNFDDTEGLADEGTTPEMAAQGWEKLSGQHHLLGWHLDRQALDFLMRTSAEFDVDEYG